MTGAQAILKKDTSARASMLVADLDRSLMFIQGALVLVLIYCHTSALHLIERLAEPPAPNISVALLVITCLLFFNHRPSLSRRSLLTLAFFETVLIATASVFGFPRLFPVMYVIIVARTGLLVSSKELLAVLLICILIYLVGKEAHYLLTENVIFSLTFTQHIFHVIVVGRLFNFVISLCFSALCVSALKGERKSRLEREQLNLEVEQLSKALERTRIAREIHDNVGHTLTSLNMQLELAQKLLVKKPERIADTLRSVKEMAQRARLDLESSLKAPDQESFGLQSKLQSLVSDSNQLNPFTTELFFNAPDPDERIQHEIYCIVKEALNNVKKYADAKTAIVIVASLDNRLLVDIVDDGTGFDTSVKIANKYGLRGMSERAELIKGKLKIESRKGAGTKVQLSVPVEPLAKAATTAGISDSAVLQEASEGEYATERLELGENDGQ